MATDFEILRLYLADPTGNTEKFTNEDLQALIDTNPDLYSAAADGWRARAGTLAEKFNATFDGATFNLSQMYDHCIKMAEHFEKLGGGSIESIRMETESTSLTNRSSEF